MLVLYHHYREGLPSHEHVCIPAQDQFPLHKNGAGHVESGLVAETLRHKKERLIWCLVSEEEVRWLAGADPDTFSSPLGTTPEEKLAAGWLEKAIEKINDRRFSFSGYPPSRMILCRIESEYFEEGLPPGYTGLCVKMMW